MSKQLKKITVVFKDAGIVADKYSEYATEDSPTPSAFFLGIAKKDIEKHDGKAFIPINSRWNFLSTTLEGLIAALLGERPVGGRANYPIPAKKGEHPLWDKETYSLISSLAAGARVVDEVEPKVEMFYARPGDYRVEPNPAVDEGMAEARLGKDFVQALRQAFPELSLSTDHRLRLLKEETEELEEQSPAIAILRAAELRAKKEKEKAGERHSSWNLTKGNLGKSFRKKNYCGVTIPEAVKRGGSNVHESGVRGAPAYVLRRSGRLELPLSAEHYSLLVKKLSRLNAAATFGEGGVAWIDTELESFSELPDWD